MSDSRFLSEHSLGTLLRSLVSVAEVKDDGLSARGSSGVVKASDSVDEQQAQESSVFFSRNSSEELLFKTRGFLAESHSALAVKHSFSSSSVAWLEMVLVEISLRNRDRFGTFWPILKHHYIRVLSGPLVTLSYVTERRVLGLLKICTRMMSRDHFSGAILELMGRIFARAPSGGTALSPTKARAGGGGLISSVGEEKKEGKEEEEDAGYTLTSPHFLPMSSHLLQHLSNQISAAMWRVLTLNVELLPLLPLEQWQTLFTIIAISASAGGFSAIKSFEVSSIDRVTATFIYSLSSQYRILSLE